MHQKLIFVRRCVDKPVSYHRSVHSGSRPGARIWAIIIVAVICFCSAAPAARASQDNSASSPTLGKIRRASTVFIDCSACPRALSHAAPAAKRALLSWDRFRIVEDPKQADMVFLFSANPYLGDYLTRKGPDTRPVRIESTIMTVVDPHTGAELWSDSRRWGSLRVAGATTDLIEELRNQLDAESRRWTVADILACRGNSAYEAFAFLTPSALLSKPEFRVSRTDNAPNELSVFAPNASDFCKRARLLVAPNDEVQAFEVAASPSDVLDIADVLELADQFDFSSGKDSQTQNTYFAAQTKDRKVVIRFNLVGRQMVLSRVTYFY
jgi:hypothetical protein